MDKSIKLTKGLVAIVDEEDYDRLSKFKWWASICHNGRYVAKRHTPNGNITMSIEVLGKKNGFQIDHRNLDSLDNRKSNLRYCTVSQNCCNRGPRKNTETGLKGVNRGLCRKQVRFRARISLKNKRVHLGWFRTAIEAARAYNAAAKKLHGDFARLNIIDGGSSYAVHG